MNLSVFVFVFVFVFGHDKKLLFVFAFVFGRYFGIGATLLYTLARGFITMNFIIKLPLSWQQYVNWALTVWDIYACQKRV